MLARLRRFPRIFEPFFESETFARRRVLPLLGLFALLVVLRVLTPQLNFTGDEPHYASQAISLFSHFLPMFDEHEVWHHFLLKSGISQSPIPDSLIGSGQEYRQSFITSLVFAIPLAAINLQAARWFDFVLAIIALIVLFQFISSATFAKQGRVGDSTANVLAIAGATFGLPFLAYTNLLYPEILLLLAVCVALRFVQQGAINGTIISALLLAFIYVRALPLSVALFAVFFWNQYKSGRSKTALYRALYKYLAGILLLLVVQVVLYGSVTAGGGVSFTPSLLSLPIRIGVQLFGVRHGLLAYSPIFFVAIAGLVSGSLRRQVACQQAALLCLVYVLTFCWASASESWTARYWIVALPFLTIGLRYWISGISSWVSVVPALPLFVITLTNALLFVAEPNKFLENRAGSITYFQIFNVSGINLSMYLPVDSPLPYFVSTVPYLLLYALAVITVLVYTSISRVRRPLYATIGLALILLPIATCYLETFPVSEYQVKPFPTAPGIDIELQNRQARIVALQFDDTYNYAGTGLPDMLAISCFSKNGEAVFRQESMRYLVALGQCYREIKITAKNVPEARAFQDTIGHVLLFSRPY